VEERDMTEEDRVRDDAIRKIDRIIEDLEHSISLPEVSSKPGALAHFQEVIDNLRTVRIELEKGPSIQ
jgi:hypothetical protein